MLKIFEVRDRSTCLSVVAFRPADFAHHKAPSDWDALKSQHRAAYTRKPTAQNYEAARQTSTRHAAINYALERSGFPAGSDAVLLCRLDAGKSAVDPYDWNDRTMQTAHGYIATGWADLRSGDVIDVEVVLGEKPKSDAKLTEALFDSSGRINPDAPSWVAEAYPDRV
jgi:hypothetical protein